MELDGVNIEAPGAGAGRSVSARAEEVGGLEGAEPQ